MGLQHTSHIGAPMLKSLCMFPCVCKLADSITEYGISLAGTKLVNSFRLIDVMADRIEGDRATVLVF